MGDQKSEMLNQIRAGWQALQSLLDSVPKDKMEDAGVAGGWSVKDVMGHITTWEEIATDRVQRIVAGQEVVRPYSDLDTYNNQEADKKRKLSLDTVRQQFLQVHQKLLSLVDGLPVEYFLPDSKPGPVITGETYKHYAKHSEDVKRWLNRSLE